MSSEDSGTGGDLRERIRGALRSQKQETVTVLSSLLAVQDELHYVPDEGIEEVASFLGSTINEVWTVASFYTNFRFTPPGKHTVSVCWGPSCHVMGAQSILKAVHEQLEIDCEGETADGAFTLAYSTCLGACAIAPVIAIDHHHRGRVTPESAARAVREAAAGHDE